VNELASGSGGRSRRRSAAFAAVALLAVPACPACSLDGGMDGETKIRLLTMGLGVVLASSLLWAVYFLRRRLPWLRTLPRFDRTVESPPDRWE
jgi:hypothetical protein